MSLAKQALVMAARQKMMEKAVLFAPQGYNTPRGPPRRELMHQDSDGEDDGVIGIYILSIIKLNNIWLSYTCAIKESRTRVNFTSD